MVKWFRESPFAVFGERFQGQNVQAPVATGRPNKNDVSVVDAAAISAQHDRSMALLQVFMQIDTFLAGFLLFSLTGERQETALEPDEKLQVILQTVTFGVFLAAIIHTAVLMMSTGWRYTLSWADPIAPGITSAIGLGLLLVTVADAVLIELRPGDDLDDPDYWYIVLFGLLLPVVLAGVVVTFQMAVFSK